jgi:hypothetical protein
MISNRLDYINKETDEESTLGMADYGVRKYDSFTSRFMTADVRVFFPFFKRETQRDLK